MASTVVPLAPASPSPGRRAAIVLLLLVLATSFAGCLRDFDEDRANMIWIRGIDVAAPEIGSGTVTLLVNVTLENTRDDSGDLTLEVKAYNTATGLLAATKTADAGTIDRDRIKTVPVPMHLPKTDGYRITAVLLQDEERRDEATVKVSQVGALRANVVDTPLAVRDLEFLVRNVSDDNVRIETQVYLTNEGAEGSEPLRVQVKAREVGTGLMAAEQWADVEVVPAEATSIVPVFLEVPEAYNYIVEAVLWDGTFIVGQGEGKVQLLPTFTVPKDEERVVDQPVVEDFVRGDRAGSADSSDEEATPGPGIVLAVGAAMAGLVWIRRRS